MTIAELKSPITPSRTRSVFRNILVATDFSPASRRALRDALALAAENHAQLSVIHVLQLDRKLATFDSPPELDLERIEAERRIKSLVGEFGLEQKIDATLVKHGPVAAQVASLIEKRRIEKNGIDLLVIGTRGRGGFQKLALGSVAEELLRVATCPVMTIGPAGDFAAITYGPGFHKILFATDFGKGSAQALPLTLALAKAQGAKLILLHVIPSMPVASASLSAYAPASEAAEEVAEWKTATRKRAIQQLKEFLPAETGLDEEPEYVVAHDFLPEAILEASGRFKVDLIVMGANQTASPKTAAHIPWTAVHEVVRDAPCPVLTVAG